MTLHNRNFAVYETFKKVLSGQKRFAPFAKRPTCSKSKFMRNRYIAHVFYLLIHLDPLLTL